ncbi:hypothetical protein BDU57DRAFT_539723 [Ampelomyces quisqualis]|uniref:Subtelomeric hrmA-associated cluster protein AFUB-079030/YDR124W-like helical bundle domain-containing protein n=1 Tax=Ampelomyces quisqualis TaxID=50730 RepID=A0A6A5QHV7_AMPQU|nr:hypothetical protein BDU57DRAFT_539723 [Ampelomyces quisqualis]
MARTAGAQAGSSAPKDRAISLPPSKGQSRDKSDFGKDPWAFEFVDFDATVNSKAFMPSDSAEGTSQPTLRSQLVAHFSSEREEMNKATPAPPTKAAVVPEEEDDVAIPTPIGEIVACELVAEDRDGRVEYIYRPICGFEHLAKTSSIAQEPRWKSPTFGGTADTLPPAYHPGAASEQPRVPDVAEHHLSHTTGTTRFNATKVAHPEASLGIVSPKVKPEPQHVTKNVPSLKRTRSIAQRQSQPRQVREASNTEDNDDEYGEERTVKTEDSKTFHVGDIEQLKIFFRNRIDELTMKPVRSMLTAWVKQLEPKRKGLHGPYHKLLPAEAPKDTPPWWPQTVPYSEPAHLDKDGLLTLAVDILLQHRDTPADEFKRRMAWTHKLRRIAELEVEMTPAEAYSSSRNLDFSTAMKNRAEEKILPSLFDVSQSYEDHVNQYELWNYENMTKAPRGKSITWHFIPKPPKSQGNRIKRQRPAERKRAQPKPTVIVESSGTSGDDTEPDDTMFKIATRLLNIHEAKEARRAARAAAKQVVARGRVPVPVSRERATAPLPAPATTFPPSPSLAPVKTKAKLATPTPQPQIEQNEVGTEASSSFDGSTTHARLQKDTSGVVNIMPDTQANRDRSNTPAHVKRVQNPNHQINDTTAVFTDDNTDAAKGGSPMESGQHAQGSGPDAQIVHNAMRYDTNAQLAADENDAKGGGFLPSDVGTQFHYSGNTLGFHPQRTAYANAIADFNSLPSSRPSSSTNASALSFPNLTNQPFADAQQLTMLNNVFPNHMDQLCFVANASLNDMDYPYATDALFNNTEANSSSAPSPQVPASFSGLSYEYGFTGSHGY